MCKHGFGVQLLQNPPLCSSTLILYLDFQEVGKYKLSVIMPEAAGAAAAAAVLSKV
jgi:hypothetical protein